jgi:phosphotransacetylase
MIHITPDLAAKADIVRNAIDLAHVIGIAAAVLLSRGGA